MTVSSPGTASESSTPRRSARKASGALTPAQQACLSYSAARQARGLGLQSHGEGAAAAAAAFAREQRPATTPRRRRAHSVEDFVLGAATEARPRVRAHTTAAAHRRRLFKAQSDEERPPEPDGPRDALADVAPADEPRLRVSLRLDDTDSAVLCELRLEQAAPAAGARSAVDELAAALEAGLSLREAPARLARLCAPALTHGQQRLSYLGNCAELRAHMAARGINTMSTAAVRRWLTSAPEAAGLVQRLVAAHGVESFAELQIDHVVSARFGGADHVFNFFVMPRALNASFNSDVSREKVDRYMGRAVARVVTAFCAYTRAAAAACVDYNAFEQQLLMHMR